MIKATFALFVGYDSVWSRTQGPLITSPLIFASCRDCPSYLASAETVRDLRDLLPAETVVLGE